MSKGEGGSSSSSSSSTSGFRGGIAPLGSLNRGASALDTAKARLFNDFLNEHYSCDVSSMLSTLKGRVASDAVAVNNDIQMMLSQYGRYIVESGVCQSSFAWEAITRVCRRKTCTLLQASWARFV